VEKEENLLLSILIREISVETSKILIKPKEIKLKPRPDPNRQSYVTKGFNGKDKEPLKFLGY